jgi:nitrous-oxide reductase
VVFEGGEVNQIAVQRESRRLILDGLDRTRGRIDPSQSFAVELPPYSQDLSDFGKLASSGWSFTNSFCTERYVGGIERGRPPFEAGCSAKDTDYLHVINWKKAAELVAAGKAKKINGFNVLMMDVSVAEGVVFLIPEPKSFHGVDVTPDGRFITVSGKLDTHTWVYSFEKIQAAIAAKKFVEKDPYGLPVISLEDALQTQVALGLGPLHTQYDSKPGIAYTSLYVDSMVAKWDYINGKLLDRLPIHYNIGHIMAMHGDTVKPRGKYVVALNKLAIDRFNPVGPLHPQNHQLIDISNEKMQLLYDMPVPLGEPHYVVAIDATLLKPIVRYPAGTNSRTDELSPFKTKPGEEKIVRNGKKVMSRTEIRLHHARDHRGRGGRPVSIHLTNLERAEDRPTASRSPSTTSTARWSLARRRASPVADKPVSLQLHRVLFACTRDGGLSARQAQGLPGRGCGGEGRGHLHQGRVRQADRGDHRRRRRSTTWSPT